MCATKIATKSLTLWFDTRSNNTYRTKTNDYHNHILAIDSFIMNVFNSD